MRLNTIETRFNTDLRRLFIAMHQPGDIFHSKLSWLDFLASYAWKYLDGYQGGLRMDSVDQRLQVLGR